MPLEQLPHLWVVEVGDSTVEVGNVEGRAAPSSCAIGSDVSLAPGLPPAGKPLRRVDNCVNDYLASEECEEARCFVHSEPELALL